MRRGLRAQVLDLFAAAPAGEAAPSTVPKPTLAPPQPPLAKRLNRNALTVAAVIMGMTVIACLVVLRGDSHAASTRIAADPTLSEPTSPTFLDHPAQVAGATNAVTTRPPSLAIAAPARASLGTVTQSTPPATTSYNPQPGYVPQTYGAPTIASTAAAVPQPREQAFNAALKRSAISRGNGNAESAEGGSSTTATNSTSLAAEESHLVAYGDSVMRNATQPGASSITATAPAGNPRRAFMQQAGDLGGRASAARLEPAGSPYVLRAGTVIPAILLTAITSDLPGDCMGQVSRDIYDSQTQRVVLIPKGSKLMCKYDDQVVAGQGRLLVAWTRLMLPDGRSMKLPGLALKDAQGQTGAKGDVDNHTRRVFGRALLLSAIGAGAQLSQPRSVTILAPPTTGQIMAGAVGQELSNVALEVLRRGMDQPPTITVPQGQTFNVFLNGDLVFDGQYQNTP